ncbi:metal-dependent transcriptional regulator [Rothia sp. CCM 9418]|uniref:metal-dependent transcriptional regulator n=1 Tax=Rothia sp. CCM 9418 TaxID=3402661 RepID=UPI003AE04C8A
MSLSDLSESTQNYLKEIWGISEWSQQVPTTTLLAQKTGNRPSSVSDALRRLANADLISYRPYAPIELTELGKKYAVSMVRRHRLLETFLVQVLNYPIDKVHDEAEVLEHAVSDIMIERIDALLGHPTRDPHGDPIPAEDGTVDNPEQSTLTDYLLEHCCQNPQRLRIERVSDKDAKILSFFIQHQLVPGKTILVRGSRNLEDIQVRHEGSSESIELSSEQGQKIFVIECES